MKKQKIVLFILLCMIFALAVGSALAADEMRIKLTADPATAKPGDDVVVTLSLENNPGVSMMALTFEFDEERLEYVGKDDSYSGWTPESSNPPKAFFYDIYPSDFTSDGDLLKINFKVKTDASNGLAMIKVGVRNNDPGMVINSDVDEIPVEDINNTKDTQIEISASADVAPESVSVSPASLTLKVGETGNLTATVLPENATDKTVSWSSSDTSIATVSNGVVTAVSAGTATITATSNADNTLSATCEVTVTAIPAGEVMPESVAILDSDPLLLEAGDSLPLSYAFTPADTTNQGVTWTSSDPDVATVDENGVVNAVGTGTAVITVTSVADNSVSTTLIVSVSDPINPTEEPTQEPTQEPTPEPTPGPNPGPVPNQGNFWRFPLDTPVLPRTGFSAVRPTVVSEKPMSVNYKPLNYTLEIPTLSVSSEIIEVPFVDGEYPITWLDSSVGLLEGSALPGNGYTVLTGHNHLNTTEVGPFAYLSALEEGERIFVRDPEEGLKIYVVYANEKISESDVVAVESIAAMFDKSLTMITCEDERIEGGYANRRVVAAMLLGE